MIDVGVPLSAGLLEAVEALEQQTDVVVGAALVGQLEALSSLSGDAVVVDAAVAVATEPKHSAIHAYEWTE